MKKRTIVITVCLFLVLVAGLVFTTITYQKQTDELEAVNEIYKARLDNASDDSDSYVSLSFDDVISVFEDLNDNADVYESIFDNDFLANLKSLNELYGACFSMYCYYENWDGSFNLSMMTDQYSEEFAENSSWLKWGFHSYNGDVTYTEENEDRVASDYDLIVGELLRVTGDAECIERVIRLSNFAGSKNSIDMIVDCEYGISGLLGPDDERDAYFLDSDESARLKDDGSIEIDGVYIISTDIRIENILGESDVINSSDSEVIVFSHEWAMDEAAIETLSDLCLEAVGGGYEFDFPRVQN